MKVLILTQTELRDLEFDYLVAKELVRFGHEVRVGSVVEDGRGGILKLKPDVVIVPEPRCEYIIDLAEVCQRMGIRVVVRNCEGNGNRSEPKDPEMRKVAFGPWPYSHCVDLQLVWGSELRDILIEERYMPADKLIVIGAPFASHYRNLENKIKTRRMRWPVQKVLMWVENWAYADRQEDYSVPEAPWGSPLHKKYYDSNNTGRKKWLEAVPRIVAKYPDWIFWFKIHPATRTFDYHKGFDPKKVKIIQTGLSQEVLPGVDVVVHSCSTMAVEAHLLDIPAIMFGDSTDGSLLSRLSPSYEDLPSDFLEHIELGKSNANPQVLKELEETLYGPLDGKAHIRIAKAIHKRVKPQKTDIPDLWPESDKKYETPGVTKTIEWGMDKRHIVQCPGCKEMVFLEPQTMLCKCPTCALMLTRKV